MQALLFFLKIEFQKLIQPTFTCSKLIETLEQGVKYVQS